MFVVDFCEFDGGEWEWWQSELEYGVYWRMRRYENVERV